MPLLTRIVPAVRRLAAGPMAIALCASLGACTVHEKRDTRPDDGSTVNDIADTLDIDASNATAVKTANLEVSDDAGMWPRAEKSVESSVLAGLQGSWQTACQPLTGTQADEYQLTELKIVAKVLTKTVSTFSDEACTHLNATAPAKATITSIRTGGAGSYILEKKGSNGAGLTSLELLVLTADTLTFGPKPCVVDSTSSDAFCVKTVVAQDVPASATLQRK